LHFELKQKDSAPKPNAEDGLTIRSFFGPAASHLLLG
jgi:hypothetical protein